MGAVDFILKTILIYLSKFLFCLQPTCYTEAGV